MVRGVHAWLEGNSKSSFDIYEDSLRKRANKTCDWMLRQDKYASWLSSDFPDSLPKLLWIHAPGGFGKTFLCSRLIEHATSTLDPSEPVVHLFFSQHGGRNDPFLAMRCWVSQMVSQSDVALQLARTQLAAQPGQSATKAVVSRLLKDIAHNIPGCTIVADGLDECAVSVGDILEDLKSAVHGSRSRLLMVSRDQTSIREVMTTNNENVNFYEFRIYPENTETDILAFSESIVQKKLSNKSLDIQCEISEAIAGKSNGQFLWAKLQSDSLRKGMNKKQLQRTINDTPSGIESIYGRDWENIMHLPGKERTLAVSILRWAALALRPLTVGELVEAVLVDLDRQDDPFDADELPDPIDQEYIDSEILGFCGSLIEIRPPWSSKSEQSSSGPDLALSSVQLTHFSVREFLIPALRLGASPGSTRITSEFESKDEAESVEDNTLAKICLHYIKFPKVWEDRRETADTTTPAHTFRQYAARFWWEHYGNGRADQAARSLVEAFFHHDNPVWEHWSRWYEITQFTGTLLDEEGPPPGPLFFAADWGWLDWVRRLLRDGHDVNARSRHGFTAAWAASQHGFTEILAQLLEARARLDNAVTMGWAELHGPARNGDLEIVRMLVAAGANVNATTQEGYTPLYLAAESENVELVKFLLDHGSDVHARSSEGDTVLHRAAWTGRVEMMKILNHRGADIHARRNNGASALHIAAAAGHAEAVQWLIDNGAETNARSATGSTPLYEAAFGGHAHVARLLLEGGGHVNAKEETIGVTPLMVSAYNGHDEVVRLLLEYGADIEEANPQGWRPLHFAARSGFPLVVDILIQAGADLNAVGPDSTTPLSLAAQQNRVAVAKLLVDAGCDINAKDSDGLTALDYANDCSDEIAGLMGKAGILDDRPPPS